MRASSQTRPGLKESLVGFLDDRPHFWYSCGTVWFRRKQREAERDRQMELLGKFLDVEGRRLDHAAHLEQRKLELEVETLERKAKIDIENAEAREKLRQIRRENAAKRPRDNSGRLRGNSQGGACRVCDDDRNPELGSEEIIWHNNGHKMGVAQ